MRHSGHRKPGLLILFVTIWAFLVGVSLVGAQSSPSRVAVLTPGLTFDPVLRGLKEGLAHLGYQEGKQITFIVEETQGGAPDLVERAARLTHATPDVLVSISASHTAAAQKATTTTPIVFAWVGDPVGLGFAASYASSKNNLTGVATASVPISGKRLEILKEIAPAVTRVLALVSATDGIAQKSFSLMEETAKKLGVYVVRRDVTSKEEIEKVLRETRKGSVDAIYHIPSALVGAHIGLLIAKAKEDRIPLAVHETSMVDSGALVSYGADFRLVGIQAAKMVAKVLRGTKPSDIPIQTPERHLLTINLSTAKAIGLTIPREVVERADRLVE